MICYKITNIFNTKYLSNEELKGFDNYKYSCIDTSPLSVYILHPFWNYIVQFLPLWIAPNLLTLLGFLLTVLNFVIFTWLDYDYYASMSDDTHQSKAIPKSVFFIVAINFFVAYTLDGIDGKQARRTKSSGPLGELFDHGVDSFASSLISATMYSIIGRRNKLLSPTRMYYIVWIVLMNFYITHFEKYVTGVLFLPWSFDISMLLIVLIYFIASIMGHEMINILFFYNITTPTICEFLCYVAFFVSLPMTVYNIYKSFLEKKKLSHSAFELLRPLVSVFMLFILMNIWVWKSPSNIIERDPRIIYLLTGVIFSNISCKLIIAQMSNTRCESFNVFLLPLSLIILSSYFTGNLFSESFLLYSFTLSVLFAHIHYGICVVQQLCHHFKIECFRIKQVNNNNKMD